MSWGYVAVAAATVASGYMGSQSAKRAGNAAQRGADAATAESARQYDQTRSDFAPYRVTGAGALNQLASLFGLPTATAGAQYDDSQLFNDQNGIPTMDAGRYANDPAYKYAWDKTLEAERASSLWRNQGANTYYAKATDQDWTRLNSEMGKNLADYRAQNPQQQPGQGTPNMSAFFQSPGYQFRRDEGTRGIERSAAASGGAFSGNALKALAEFNSGLASQEFGNYFNQLASIAGIGQTATNQTAAYGANNANNASRNALYAGDARASGIIGQSNAWGSTIQGLGGLAGYAMGRQQPYQMNGDMSGYAGSGVNPYTGRRG